MIIKDALPNDLTIIALLIRNSHEDVAAKFGLTLKNCPKHPSFCTEDWVKADVSQGKRYFIAQENVEPIGCVAYESSDGRVAHLNRLSVLPTFRKRGIGTCLVEHVIRHAHFAAIQVISIGIIADYTELQCWYQKFGFKESEIKQFSHLPFSVKYMTLSIDQGA